MRTNAESLDFLQNTTDYADFTEENWDGGNDFRHEFQKPHEFMTTSGILKLAVIGVISVRSAYPFNPWLGSLPPLPN